MTNDHRQTLMQFHLRKRLALMSIDQARYNGQSISQPMAELEAACNESMSYAASIADVPGSFENRDRTR